MLTQGKCAEGPVFLLCAGSIAKFLGSCWILQELIYFLELLAAQPGLFNPAGFASWL